MLVFFTDKYHEFQNSKKNYADPCAYYIMCCYYDIIFTQHIFSFIMTQGTCSKYHKMNENLKFGCQVRG